MGLNYKEIKKEFIRKQQREDYLQKREDKKKSYSAVNKKKMTILDTAQGINI
jgi:hypothetical protein